MKIPTVERCCCCLSLRAAGLIMGVLAVLANMLAILTGKEVLLNGECAVSIMSHNSLIPNNCGGDEAPLCRQ